jgi:hypothetical protein
MATRDFGLVIRVAFDWELSHRERDKIKPGVLSDCVDRYEKPYGWK